MKRMTVAQMLQPTFDAVTEVHRRWDRLRQLQQAENDLRVLCRLVPPSLARQSAKYLRCALKSLQGAVRHADRMHAEAQRAHERRHGRGLL